MQRGLKDIYVNYDPSAFAAVSMQRGLKDVPVASMIAPVIHVSMQRGLKVLHIPVHRETEAYFVSMQRGLKVARNIHREEPLRGRLNAKRIERLSPENAQALKQTSVSMQRGLKGRVVSCLSSVLVVVSMQRGLKAFWQSYPSPYFLSVSMQRGLKVYFIIFFTESYPECLNAKRIESLHTVAIPVYALNVSMQRGLKGKTIKPVPPVLPMKSQCKEDWKGEASHHISVNEALMSQCKEDWKWETLQKSPTSLTSVSMQRGLKVFIQNHFKERTIGLNAKRIESVLGRARNSGSEASLNAKRIESYVGLIPSYLELPVSMQRGLKDMNEIERKYGKELSQCKEDWKTSYFPSPYPDAYLVSMQRGLKVAELYIHLNSSETVVSMQRGLKECDVRPLGLLSQYLRLNAKRIERLCSRCRSRTLLARSQCKEDWKG